MSEVPMIESTHLFNRKTIERVDASACNFIQFAFTDGTRVALHIEVDRMGLPEVLACTECVTIVRHHPDWMYEPMRWWQKLLAAGMIGLFIFCFCGLFNAIYHAAVETITHHS